MPEPKKQLPNGAIPSEPLVNGTSGHKSRSKTKSAQQHVDSVDISPEIDKTVQKLKADLDRLTNKVSVLENTYRASSSTVVKKRNWFFGGLTPQVVAFIVLWPFLASFVTSKYLIRK